MGQCETCGNEYDKSFDIVKDGETHTFDSFECAIQKLAPTCGHCSCRIIGHGLEADGIFFCCDHCAVAKGVAGLNDRVLDFKTPFGLVFESKLMSTENHREKLFQLIEGIEIAMLVSQTADGLLHSRPMVTRRLEDDQRLWFLTDKESTKVFEIINEKQVNVSFANPGSKTWVSVSGTARVTDDRDRIEQLWMPMARAWFPGGKDDPNLTLIEVTPSLAEYWDEPAGNYVKLRELAIALASGQRVGPDYSDNQKVDLRS